MIIINIYNNTLSNSCYVNVHIFSKYVILDNKKNYYIIKKSRMNIDMNVNDLLK